jgi:hypothetical protein
LPVGIMHVPTRSFDAKQKFKGGIPLELVNEVRAASKAEMGGKPHGLMIETEKVRCPR